MPASTTLVAGVAATAAQAGAYTRSLISST